MAEKKQTKQIAQNRKAYHDYFIEQTYEAGLALLGTEVKALRTGRANLKDSYCSFKGGELYALGLHISPYDMGSGFNHDPLREKKLLLHKAELRKLVGLLSREGYTLVPLSLYFSGSRVKMALGLCKGKKLYDKRESMAKAEAGRMMARVVKENAVRE